VLLLEHYFEQHQQVEVDPRKISSIQHMCEIVSLDSSGVAAHAAHGGSMNTRLLLLPALIATTAIADSPARHEAPARKNPTMENIARLLPAAPADARAVLDFWREAGPSLWFAKDAAFDARFRERFLRDHEAAARGELDCWMSSADGALALIVLLDQFPRNAFRGTARMYDTDALARRFAAQAFAAHYDQQIPLELRKFLLLPFAHSEELADQERSVALARELTADDLAHAEHHRDIVRRFGRFPHRNRILGRETTAAEQAWLDHGGYQG
jgi:uncharacterized protein (DUF924 family)